MANSGPNTNKQQFFITYAKQPHLNNVYTVFGKYVALNSCVAVRWGSTRALTRSFLLPSCRVIDGLDVLDSMEKVPVDAKHRPAKEITIQSVTIHANPIAEL